MSQKQALVSVEIKKSTYCMHYNAEKYVIKWLHILILLPEQMHLSHGKLRKVHGKLHVGI